MKMPKLSRSSRAVPLLVAVGLAGTAIYVGESRGSDHVDTAEVELSPTLDLNDVYVFPGSSDGRIVLVMDVASPINALGRNVRGFDPNALYQFKIDNNGDAREDLVLQFLFDEMTNGTQRVNVLGPAAPNNAPGDTTGMLNRLIASPVSAGNPFNQNFTTANGMQVFAGPRNDPFYLDFEQFVQILPDRRPATFLTGVATDAKMPTAFCGAAPPFDVSCQPKDFFAGANTLSIVVEMPESMLNPGTGANAKLGIWATIGR
ncbi:MAG TPA: DUF4331 family protein [Longimicrobiaceae bacterium]|nr:DUF4331 family protein [Longimicrobiaceae bacterium]